MTYATVEQGVATVIKKVSGFSASNVKQGDYRPLGNGVNKAAILQRGTTPTRERISFGSNPTFETEWTINVELYTPFRGESVTQKTSQDSDAQSLLDELAKWPELDGVAGVIDAQAQTVSEPEQWQFGRGYWWRQVIPVNVRELESVAQSE